jgi:hypothetical protein
MVRELDQRRNDVVTVTLLWNTEMNRVFVTVLKEWAGASFRFEVAGAEAADALTIDTSYAGYSLNLMRSQVKQG